MRRALYPWVAVFFCLSAWDAFAMRDVITLSKAKRGPVPFTHRNHLEKYAIACDRCHHSTEVPPTPVSCKECHLNRPHRGVCHDCHTSDNEPDAASLREQVEKRTGKSQLPNLFRAFHSLCRNCHIAENAAKGTKAPVECGGCHGPMG